MEELAKGLQRNIYRFILLVLINVLVGGMAATAWLTGRLAETYGLRPVPLYPGIALVLAGGGAVRVVDAGDGGVGARGTPLRR